VLDSSVLVGIIRGEPDTGRLLGLLRATNVFSCQAELVEQTAGAGPAEGVPGSDCKRVEEADAGLLEAGVVARDNDQVVDEGRGGDQAVFDRHCAPRGAKTCEQFCPPQARFSFPCQAMKPLNARGDGRSRLVRLFPLRNSKMPNLNSPRIMGSTAYSRSLRRGHSTTLETGAGLVGSLNTLASTRYLTARRSTRIRRERRNLSRGTRATSPPRPHSAAPNAA